MGDETKDPSKPQPEVKTDPIDLSAKTLDPVELSKQLARDELNSKKKAKDQVDKKYDKKEAAVLADSSAKKAELLVEVAPKVSAEAKKPTSPEVAKTPILVTTPTTTPAVTPAVTPSTQPATTPAATPEKKKGPLDEIKDFFSKLSTQISLAFAGVWDKIKGMWSGKKEEKKVVPATPNSPSTAPTSTPISSSEKPSLNKENWRSIIAIEAQRLGIDPAFAEAIVNVEAGKSGLNQDGSLKIRFEPHVFNAQLKAKGISKTPGGWGASTLVGRNVDGVSCDPGQANEHACLRKAMEIDKDAALSSASMGLGQIMGFNAKLSGYANAEDMFNKFSGSGGGEAEQIRGMFRMIERAPAILAAARSNNFTRFAAVYNGAKEGSALNNKYASSLQGSYNNAKGSAANPSKAA